MDSYSRVVCRVIHFLSLFGTGAFLTAEYLDSKDPAFKRIGHFSAIGFLITGIINWLLLKKFKRDDNKRDFRVWTAIVHSKIVAVIVLFTPFSKTFITNPSSLLFARLVVILVYVLLSPYARMLREESQSQKPKET